MRTILFDAGTRRMDASKAGQQAMPTSKKR